jgi:predicted enzyme related to lactoylglutathione lyase
MSRLSYAIAFTKNVDAMIEFYAEQVGLRVRRRDPEWVEFETGGATLALHEQRDEKKQGLLLRFALDDLDAQRRALESRGIRMEAEFRLPNGRVADAWDPEGNLVSFLQALKPPPAGIGPVLERAIVNARDFGRAVSFYRGPLGLSVATEAENWVEFDTGDTRLTVHHRPADGDHPRHAEQPIALVFGTDDLTEWCETMRARGMHFVTAPMTEDFGVYAEAVDPDGRIVVFHEPPPAETVEEELAEAYEDDGAPRRVAMRKPLKKASATASMMALKPIHKSKPASKGRRRRPSATTMAVASVRGAGPERARLKPKRTADEKKARVKPAIGRDRKAEMRTLTNQRSEAARASKSRPVKRASANSVRRKSGSKGGARTGRGGR